MYLMLVLFFFKNYLKIMMKKLFNFLILNYETIKLYRAFMLKKFNNFFSNDLNYITFTEILFIEKF